MKPLLLYGLPIFIFVGVSTYTAQQWRYEGQVEESRRAAAGGIAFEQYRAAGEAEALKILAEKERDGTREGAAILAHAKFEGRQLAFEGLIKQIEIQSSGDIATRRYYLDPLYGSEGAIFSLQGQLASLQGEERENAAVALKVLLAAKERTGFTIARLRTEAAKRATEAYRRQHVDSAGEPRNLPIPSSTPRLQGVR